MSDDVVQALEAHNKRVLAAGVGCDGCGTGMEYDTEVEAAEDRKSGSRPVRCPECGYVGVKHSGW